MRKGNIDMRKVHKVIALALGSVLGLAAFAACGKDGDVNSKGDAPNYQICYDNIADNITIPASATQVAVEGAKIVAAYDADGNEVKDPDTIATYKKGVFTAVGAGRVRYQLKDGTTGNVEVVPAYPTDPDYAYDLSTRFNESTGEKTLGYTHDPSIIETRNSKGQSVYYMFSTGWNNLSTYKDKTTYGNAIHVSYDGMKTWEMLGRTFDYANREEEVVNSKLGEWLYGEDRKHANDGGGIMVGGDNYTTESASWWAPDVVEKPDGGYWLYTCVVDGGGTNKTGNGGAEGLVIGGTVYTRACILLYESDTLEPGSFTPVLDRNGDPYVFVQSSLNGGPGDPGSVNAIDPQIIYSPEGNMYMAMGSFGSGVYLLELDPNTGKRKETTIVGKDEENTVTQIAETGWITHEQMQAYKAEITTLNVGGQNSDTIGWAHAYYGKNIGKSDMEAPVIARHDNVEITDENGEVKEGSGKTYYYTMQSYDGLADNYSMWGGRSESPWGLYLSTNGGIIRNDAPGSSYNTGNKYIGGFVWHNIPSESPEFAGMHFGHNDLFTTSTDKNVAAYIVRQSGQDTNFVTQVHQYYLNSMGDICINPNRYADETSRAVSVDELFRYTQEATAGSISGIKLKMAAMVNAADNSDTAYDNHDETVETTSRDVILTRNSADPNRGDIYEADGTTLLGTWQMYGNGYIVFKFNKTLKASRVTQAQIDTGEKVYYGVVRTAWLNDQNKSGITISCMGNTPDKKPKNSLAMFMNNYSVLTNEMCAGLVGTQYADAAEE